MAMPYPFAIEGNDQRAFRKPRFSMFSKQWKPTSLIPYIQQYPMSKKEIKRIDRNHEKEKSFNLMAGTLKNTDLLLY